MKKILVVILYLSLYCSSLHSQWVTQTVPDSASILNSINFINTNNGVSTGWDFGATNITSGRALYTTNAGANWISGTVPYTCRIIASVKYITPQILYGTGALNLSIDKHKSGDYDFMGRLKPSVSKNISYAGNNAKGAFFKSTNGGLNWLQYGTVPADCSYFTYMDFINENTGVVLADVGPNGTNFMNILRTTNGGLTWSPTLTENFNGQIVFIKYASDNVIFAGGFYNIDTVIHNVIFKSTNGGTNWTTQLRDTVYSNAVHFINSQTGFTAGGESEGPSTNSTSGHVYKTTDQGISWNKVLAADTIAFQGINFFGETGVGIAFGNKNFNGSSYIPYAFRTSNFGLTWSVQRLSENDDPLVINSFMLDKYNYYISGIGANSGAILHTTNGGSVGVTAITGFTPDKFSLEQNYPNPFNPTTTIKFNVQTKSNIFLKVYDINGKELTTLLNDVKTEGSYEVNFDASAYPSGIYYYRLISDSYSETRKMILIK
ncbi:MAG: T9SS type A sorting domain-containing protein [Bacteroidetes bacterium]|nr:T9SS type A sorting domain-containing protein [Bacteroidota bacterium]